MPDLILHHFERSPYSEKIRAILGYKGLPWKSVLQPIIMPKPELTALTGGYRRIPVLQIGADIYCDTALIAEQIELSAPTPSLFPGCPTPSLWPSGDAIWSRLIINWADEYLFWKVARYARGANIDTLPDDFLKDRAAMFRQPPPDKAQVKAEMPHFLSQLEIALPWLNDGLDKTEYIGGSALSLADFSVYHCLWFLRNTPEGGKWLDTFDHINAWMKKIAAIGHGQRTELDRDGALAIARAAEPLPVAAADNTPDSTGIALGDTASVTPETFGTENVVGKVVALSKYRITLARSSDDLGVVHVHFPRLGYVLKRS